MSELELADLQATAAAEKQVDGQCDTISAACSPRNTALTLA